MPKAPPMRICLVVAVLVSMVVGCEDQLPPTEPSHDPSLSTAESPQTDSHWTIDKEYDRLAREEIPGFGGFFFDENLNPVVYLRDPARRAEAERWVGRVQAELGAPTRALIVRTADYDFTELKEWRDQLRGLFARDDVVSLDIDEKSNRLRIGVQDAAALAAVRREVVHMEVPSAAVHVEVRRRPESRSTLREGVRPVDAGYQIDNEDKPYCTLGFNALHAGQEVFVSASHCSATTFSEPDYSMVYQPTDGWPADSIGEEINDRQFYLCNPPSFLFLCRWSDAAAFRYFPGVQFERGYIARTDSSAQGQPGSLDIDESDRRFEISGKGWAQYVGWTYEKMGRSTGWTKGPLTESCTDIDFYEAGGYPLLCQMVAAIYSGGGDSGSPIFRQTRRAFPYDHVVLHGVLWGGPLGISDTTYFSPYEGVEKDLGIFYVQPEPTQPPLTASIGGPIEVKPGAYCNWWANADGGDPPYDYEWSGALSGDGMWVAGSLYSSDWLYLDVWDDDSPPAHVERKIWVTVDPDAPVCFEDDREDF